MNPFVERMIRAAKLDVNLYEEVEADKTATLQSMIVIILSSVATGIGAARTGGIIALLSGIIAALIGWLIWSYLIFIIGTKILPSRHTVADYGELLRTIGFASSPGLIRILGVIPGLAWISTTAASIWMFITMIIAVRQALDYKSTARAFGVCAIGGIVYMVTLGIFYILTHS